MVARARPRDDGRELTRVSGRRVAFGVASHYNAAMVDIDEIKDNFALLDDWDDRYRYVIELGRALEPLPEADRNAANKVNGCASQVWLSRQEARSDTGEPILIYLGDSDAHIVRGLIAILLALMSGRTPRAILDTDAVAVFNELGFKEHLTPQRSNGLRAMVERIRSDAKAVVAATE